MYRAHVRSDNDSLVRRDRRLVAGIAVSVLLHGLLLSLQFGVPGFDAGPGGPIQVTLAPPAPSTVPDPLPEPAPTPAPPADPLPPLPAPPVAARGLRLVDPLPKPVEISRAPEVVKAAPRPAVGKPARRKAPKRRTPVSAPLIASTQADSPFVVAPALPDIEPDLTPGVAAGDDEDQTLPNEIAVAARDEVEEVEPRRDDEALRVAATGETQRKQAEAERMQLDEEQERLAALEREAAALRDREALVQQEARQREQQQAAQQQLARQQAEQQAVQQQLARQQTEQQAARQRLAEQQAAQQRLAEQQMEAERARIAQLAAQQLEAQRRADAEQQRLAQLREREQALARQQAQQLAAERLAAEEAERRITQAQAQAQERRRAEELAQRQAAEDDARRQAAERAQAERIARQRLEEAGRLAAERQQAQALPGNGGPGPGGPGSGSGDGARVAATVPGGATASRARELLRGLNLPNVAPLPARPDPFGGARRVLADGAERDAPLRLYVDSVRQKLERNAILGGARLALREVRIDPLVSVSLRSDGSIDDVTIVRSSGRADVDDTVRRFIQLNARYSAFPPNVAARFDVIEIRRVWRFADGLKLLEEMR